MQILCGYCATPTIEHCESATKHGAFFLLFVSSRVSQYPVCSSSSVTIYEFIIMSRDVSYCDHVIAPVFPAFDFIASRRNAQKTLSYSFITSQILFTTCCGHFSEIFSHLATVRLTVMYVGFFRIKRARNIKMPGIKVRFRRKRFTKERFDEEFHLRNNAYKWEFLFYILRSVT